MNDKSNLSPLTFSLSSPALRSVIVKPAMLDSVRVMKVAPGRSIREIIDEMYDVSGVEKEARDYALMVEIDGRPLPRETWHYVPSVNEHVLIFAPVRDGKDIGRALMMMAVVIASIYTGGAAGAAWGSLAQAATAAAVATAGMLLVNALFPVRLPDSPAAAAQKTGKTAYNISGTRNEMPTQWTPVPSVLGTHRMYPYYITRPYTEILGNDEYLRVGFVWGEGPLKIEDLRIGDTALTSFTDYEIENREGRDEDEPVTLMPESVVQVQVNLVLTYADYRTVIRESHPGATELSIDGMFPGGLTRHTDAGGRVKCPMWVGVYYREKGESDWIEATELYFKEKTYDPIRFGHQWTVDPEKIYEVAVTRNATDVEDPGTISDVYWTNFRSFLGVDPVTYPRPLAMSVLRIKATDQLQGVIESFNGLVSSYAEVWDDEEETWGGDETTKNPAALYRLALTRPANMLARTSAQINNAVLGAWYEFCAAQGYEFNAIYASDRSVWDVLADIAAAGRGAVAIPNGVWGAIYDDETAPVVQHITPRNSWGGSASKTFYNRPHGFRVRFKNELNNYLDDERIVLDDGFQLNGVDAFGNAAADLPLATLFESIEFPGITHPDLAWRFARYYMAEARLRPEVFTRSMDWEQLAITRGSKVLVADDIPMWGTKWGRIKYLVYDETAENVVGVGLDERFAIAPPAQYVIRVRRADADNTSQLINLDPAMEAGEHAAATFETPVAVAEAPEIGDLAIIGEYSKDTTPCLIKNIYFADNMSARIEYVQAAPEIYDSDTGAIPAFNPNITRVGDITDILPPAPAIVAVQSGTNSLEATPWGSIRSRIFVTCSVAATDVRIDRYRVRYRVVNTIMWHYAEAPANSPTAYLTDVDEGESYEIQAQAISVYNAFGPWSAALTHVVVGQSQVPSDVEYFTCNIVGSEAHLSWLPVTDIDLSHYRIRWSPLEEDALWGDSIDVVERVGKPATHINAPAMIGSYLIKAVDYTGKESTTAAVAKTNISHIPGYTNAESFTQPDPTWSGTGDGADYDSDFGGIALTLSGGEGGTDLTFEDRPEDDLAWGATEYMAFGSRTSEPVILEEGYYEFDNVIDLDGVYTVRLYADMETSSADISTDLYDLADLYDVVDLYASREGVCGVDLEMRFTSDDPSTTPTWSDWQKVLVGDYTARAFQFRTVLWTTVGTVTPILTAITVYLDMADRVHPFDASVEIGGSAVSFDPPFYGVPSVGLAVANGQAGDTYAITGLARTGFTIAFTNGGGGVARTISGVARGYGEEEV